MANYNLTNQEIKDSFQQLLQVSSSGAPSNENYLFDGTGSAVNSLQVTSSLATSASHAIIADSALSATNADTASFFGEGIVTASALASTITFTKDNGTTFDVTVAQSGSVESASYAAFASNAESASYATSASSAIYSVSSSYSIKSGLADNATNATTSSHAVSALSASYAISASHSEEADHAAQADDLVINVKNLSGETLAKGTAVHATGVTGENVTVIKADASIAGNMPAVALLNEQLADNATGEAIINGRLIGVDTSALVAGASVYVTTEGNLTATKPTGSLLIQNIGTAAKIDASDGEIIIQGSGRSNDLPNLTSGYAWVGDSNGVPQAVTTSSFANVASALTASYVNTLNQSVIISGSRLDFEGGNSNDGLYVEGGSVNLNAKGTKQYSNMRQYYDTDKWSGNFNGYQLINNSSGSEAFTGLMAISTFTGYDGSNPVFYLQGGGNNGSYQNTILRSSYNKPWVNITKQASFDSAITASAVISASGGIEGNLTGDVTGNISSSGTSTFNNISVVGSGSFTGTQTFNNINVNGTGSFGYIESVTGSAKIIGDAFIVLNNNTPAERYAGIIVQDSGSTLTTASFQWDGGNNEWFLEYSDDGGATAEHGIALFGPEYATKGSPNYLTNNTIPKSNGGHHLNDSNIIDNGTLVTVNSNISASGDISGSRFNATNGFQTDAASALGFISTKAQSAFGNITVEQSTSPFVGLTVGSAAVPTRAPGITMYTSHSFYPAGFNYAGITINDGDNGVTFYGNKVNAGGSGAVAPANEAAFVIQAGTTADSTTGDNTTFAINNDNGLPTFTKTTRFLKDISGSGNITANEITGSALQVNGTIDADNVNIGSSTSAVQFGNRINYYDSEKNTGNIFQGLQFINNASGSSKFATQMEITTYSGLDSTGGINQPVFRLRGGGDNGVNGHTIIWSSYDKPQAYFAKDSIFQSDVDVQGDLQVDGVSTLSGSVITSGSVATEVISGSHDGSNIYIDYSLGNMFSVELQSGSLLIIEAQNIQKGQTAMIELRQPTATGAYGTIDFADAYKFTDGTHPQATQASGSIDILTFTSFDGTTLAGTSVLNLK